MDEAMPPPPHRFCRFGPFVALVATLLGCVAGPPPEPECEGPADCGALDPAPCDACGPLATALCVDGACEERGVDAVNVVVANLLIDRAVDGLAGLRHAVVSAAPCARALALDDELNVLATGQKSLAGGDLHQDVGVGRVPEGPVTVVVFGTAEAAGGGAVLARGCAADLVAAAPELIVQQLNLE